MRARRKDARRNESWVREKSARSEIQHRPGGEIRAANPTPEQISATIRGTAAELLQHPHCYSDEAPANKARCRRLEHHPIPECLSGNRKFPGIRCSVLRRFAMSKVGHLRQRSRQERPCFARNRQSIAECLPNRWRDRQRAFSRRVLSSAG